MDVKEHRADEAPDHRAVARPLISAINWEHLAMKVRFIGDAKFGFEEVACLLDGFLHGQDIHRGGVRGYPWDDVVITAGGIKILFDVGFVRCPCYLVLQFFDTYWDKELTAGQAAILTGIECFIF